MGIKPDGQQESVCRGIASTVATLQGFDELTGQPSPGLMLNFCRVTDGLWCNFVNLFVLRRTGHRLDPST